MKAVVTLAVFLSCSLIVFALAATDLRRKLVRRLARHGSTFSGVGASDKPGAVQYAAVPIAAAVRSAPQYPDHAATRLERQSDYRGDRFASPSLPAPHPQGVCPLSR